MRSAFHACGGHEVDTQGDAFFVAFTRATDAVCAAVEIQRTLAHHAWPVGVTVRVRMGLHTGQPRLSSEGYVGLDVHHAARIMSAGHGGQVLLSQTTRDLAAQGLPEGVGLQDLGEHRLKDIKLPGHLYQLVIEGMPVNFPPLKTIGIQPTKADRGFPWSVPFLRNPFFTGRDQLLEHLHAQFSRTQSVTFPRAYAFSGLGGIGKTQAAIEYAYRYREEYTAVLWVRAASRETLVADFVSLARGLHLPEQDAQDQMQIVVAVRRWLEQHEDWLMILDNADELSLLADFLPTKGKGHLLLTTRTQATGRIARKLSVEALELSQGIRFLLHRAKLLDSDKSLDNVSGALRSQAQALVEELGGLPLALEQAGSYIEETGCSLSEYLPLYLRRRAALLKRQSAFSSDYTHTVASTWVLSFQQVEQQSPAAAEVLHLCTFLHPDAIPEVILIEGAAELGPVLQAVTSDPLEFNEAIQFLRRYSLIKRDPEAKLLNMHRLVQVVIKESLDEATKQLWAERAIRMVNAAFPDPDFETWSRCEHSLPHVWVCADLIKEYHIQFPEAARLLHQAGFYLRERGLYVQAEVLLQQALHIREQVCSPEHSDTAATLHQLALLYWLQGKFTQADPLYQRALTINEHILGPEHPSTAATLNDLALLYQYQGKYEQAEPLYRRALAINEQALGPEHSGITDSLNNLALLYFQQGKYEEAEPLYRRALAINEQALGPDHPETAPNLNNLARLYDSQGKYEQAEALYQRALSINEQALGPEHPSTISTLNNLALLSYHQGKYAQAESLCTHALALRERVLGPEHPRVAFGLHTLAQISAAQGQYEQAEALYQRALRIRERALGPEHPETVQAREDYTKMLQTRQRLRTAAPREERE